MIVALDTRDPAQAQAWVGQTSASAQAYKLGLEFCYANGFAAAATFAKSHPLFLDLKLHDIPNTVGAAVDSLTPVAPKLLTVHASGGAAMIAAARAALERRFAPADRPILLAVTVLTSTDADGLRQTGVDASPRDQVLRLGALAMDAGADGLVCSAHEIAPLRDRLGTTPVLVVPGIRPAGSSADDQARIMTPTQAARAGADWIVVGRPITRADDPGAAAASIAAELSAAS
nr:orotidine-5'-phosphate decarboxylase [Ameyamaea chiangmaiensis]